jgi:hypothetical protein
MSLTHRILRNGVARAALAAALGAGFALAAPQAHALPSFAQQTGQPCAACHVGGYGPQLTPFGRSFKLHAYGATASWSGAQNKFVPLSGMVVATGAHTAKDQSAPPANNMGVNDNFAFQEADVFIAGKLAPGFGVMIQGTTDTIGHNTLLDNSDIRYARDVNLFGKDVTWGVSVNNNPSVQDVWNTTPAWRFPYVGSALAPGPIDAPILAGGLAHQVIGETGYLWIDNHFYLEAGGYQGLSANALNVLHEGVGPGVMGTAPYWRFAYSREFNGQAAEIGFYGMSVNLSPDRSFTTADHYRDVAVDGSWQYIGTGKHVFSVNASYIRETRKLDASFALEAANFRKGHIDDLTLDFSYYYDRTYGFTTAYFSTAGSFDDGLYGPAPDAGSLNGKPNSSGFIVQGDWTPFGKDTSWGRPWANVRLGLQYTGYTRFNGGVTNYDGFGRNASDNNTLTAFVWTAF